MFLLITMTGKYILTVVRKMNESAIVTNIILGLKLKYKTQGFFWRASNHGVFQGYGNKGEKRYSFHGIKGMSDILGVLKDGKFVAIEVKTPTAFKCKNHSLSPYQIEFLNTIESFNGIGMCVKSFEDVEILLKPYLCQKK